MSKHWHYKIDLQNCSDPAENGYGKPLECPTDTDYPADTICGFDFSKLACFSPGESGSPLMLSDSTKTRRGEDACPGAVEFCEGAGLRHGSQQPDRLHQAGLP